MPEEPAPGPNDELAIPLWIYDLLAALCAWAVLFGFVLMYVPPILRCWQGESDLPSAAETVKPEEAEKKPSTQEELYAYVATALTGLVGAVVAMVFSIRIPPTTVTRSGLTAAGVAIQRSLRPRLELSWQQWLAVAYSLTYLVLGIAAIVTALAASGHSALVQNYALISFGVIIAIVQRSLNVSR